jgi:hypothetical protein
MFLFGAPYLVFELLIGPWLMIKGISDGSEINRSLIGEMSSQPV